MCPRKTQHHLDGCSLDCLAFLYFHIIYAGCFNVFFFLVLLLPSLSFSSLPVCALFIHIFLRIHQTTGAFAPCVFFSICGIIYSMWCGRLLKCSRSVVCSVTQNINYNIAFTPAVHLSRCGKGEGEKRSVGYVINVFIYVPFRFHLFLFLSYCCTLLFGTIQHFQMMFGDYTVNNNAVCLKFSFV